MLVVKMLVNQGEEEFEEGLKAKKTVKATNANMNPYAKVILLLVLKTMKRPLKSVMRVPPLMDWCLMALAMVTFCCSSSSQFFLLVLFSFAFVEEKE
ncbi:hypothetical protein ACOSQ2_026044 [Xanthoceras sorbifolium]